jgi:hypothetical protein
VWKQPRPSQGYGYPAYYLNQFREPDVDFRRSSREIPASSDTVDASGYEPGAIRTKLKTQGRFPVDPNSRHSIVNFRVGRKVVNILPVMTLSIGTKAPDFARSCKTSDGINLVRLSENFGKKNALWWFFPMASTGVCSLSTGVIQYAESSDDPEQQPNFAAIKATLQKLG